MRSFVDKVKAGKWGNVMSAVANLGAAATSVGVSVGVAAAEPIAKDIARSFEELTGSVEVSFCFSSRGRTVRSVLLLCGVDRVLAAGGGNCFCDVG